MIGTTRPPHRQLPPKFSVVAVDRYGERRSLVWNFVLKPRDIYMAPGLQFGAPAPSFAHFSLHANGRCHHAFDSDYYKQHGKAVTGTDNRFMHHWTRASAPMNNIAPALSIMILPDAPGVPPSPDEGERFDFELPTPKRGEVRGIAVGYSLSPPTGLVTVDEEVLGFHPLATGEFAYLLTASIPLDPRSFTLPQAPVSGFWLAEDRVFPPHMRTVLYANAGPNHAVGYDAFIRPSKKTPRELEICIGAVPRNWFERVTSSAFALRGALRRWSKKLRWRKRLISKAAPHR